MSTLFTKDPDSVLDYGFDLSAWLATGETVDSVVWTIPTGLTKQIGFTAPGFVSGEYNDGTQIMVAISGGTLGANYEVVARFTTTQGRMDDRTFALLIESK